MSQLPLASTNDFEKDEAPLLAAQEDGTDTERNLARLRLLWDHRLQLSRITAAALVISLILAFLIPKEYQSTARLMPPDSRSDSGLAMVAALTGRAGLGGLGSSLLGLKSTGAVFVAVLRSRTVQDHLVERFQLKNVYGVKLNDSARKALAKQTSVAEDLKSGIITITVTDRDPVRASKLGEAYVSELDGLITQLSTSSARRERLFLEDRLKTVKLDLDNAARRLSTFSSQNATLDIKEQAKVMMDASATLAGQLVAAESELSGLRQIYSDNNIRVRSINARIAELRRQLAVLGGKQNAVDGSRKDKNEELPYPTLRELPALGVTYADLYREVKIQESVYEALTQEYEFSKVQESKELPTVKILDAPEVPERKSYPPRLTIALMGMLLGLGFGCAWVYLRERWSETSPDHPRKQFALEILHTFKAAILRRTPFRLRKLS